MQEREKARKKKWELENKQKITDKGGDLSSTPLIITLRVSSTNISVNRLAEGIENMTQLYAVCKKYISNIEVDLK